MADKLNLNKSYSGKEPQPELVVAWQKAIEMGIAGDLCDRIVKNREIPNRLANTLVRAFAVDEDYYEFQNRGKKARKEYGQKNYSREKWLKYRKPKKPKAA